MSRSTHLRRCAPRYLIQGCVCRDVDSQRLIVFVDSGIADHHELQYRSVLGEEFGHVMLQRRVIQNITSIEEVVALYRHPDAQLLERDARAFGRAILMPTALS